MLSTVRELSLRRLVFVSNKALAASRMNGSISRHDLCHGFVASCFHDL